MIKLIKPYISYSEVEEEFRAVFDSGMFTKGENVQRLVDAIKDYTGAKHAFLATSATTALTMCLKLLEIGPGDEVIVADFSFPATVNVVEDVGAKPIFADVDPDTYNMLPEELINKITSRTKAVIYVDALGNPSGITQIKEICSKHDIPLIEDSACAIGSSENGLKCGNIADLTCFSFHPRKLLTTGEGGAITTNNDRYADILKIKLNHGAEFTNGRMDFVDYGYNYRLPELQAIMGIKQIEKLDEIVQQRIKMKENFSEQLVPLGFRPQQVKDSVVHNVQSLVFSVPDDIDRDALIEYLKQRSIETTLGTYCLSATTYFSRKYDSIQPNAFRLEQRTITLPCHPDVDVQYVVDAIKSFVK